MVKTAKERQAKRREKLKKDDAAFKVYLEKDRVRKAKKRKHVKEKMNEKEQEEQRVKERIRIRNYRAKKKQSLHNLHVDSDVNSSPYQTKQATGRALKRLARSLPKSPRKKRFVVAKIAKQVGLTVQGVGPSTRKGLSNETIDKIIAFYNNNEVSWQAPGIKDRIIIREVNSTGEKVKRTEQLRYLSSKEYYKTSVVTHT